MITHSEKTLFKKVLYFLLVACLVIGVIIPLSSIDAYAANAPSGYTNSDSSRDVVAYKSTSNGTDVQGYYNNYWIRTTYGNGGYNYMTSYTSGSMSVTQSRSIVNNGKYVKLTYKVTAGSNGLVGGKLGVHADVMIGDNDYATVSVVYNNGKAVGLQMTDTHTGCSSKNAQYRLYFDGVAGVTPVSTYWMGRYSYRQDNCFKQVNTNSVSGIDSGLAISWQNINLAANESKEFSIIIGVGEVQTQIQTPAEANSFSLVGDANNAGKMNVQMSFVDTNTGVTDSLMYSIAGQEYTLATASATGLVQVLGGTADLSSVADGTYPVSFWILNSNGAISSATTRNITVQNGKIVGGLDGAIANVNVQVNGNEWALANRNLVIGTSLNEAVPNGSVLANGTYNVYFNQHLIGTVQMNGGYTAPVINWAPINIIDINSVYAEIYDGTPASELVLPEYVYAVTAQGYTVQVKVQWVHQTEVYTPYGDYTVYANPIEVVGYEGFAANELFTFSVPVSASVNVLHNHNYETHRTEPTCATSGQSKDVCTICGHTINVVYIPAFGHDYSIEVTKEATCAEDGIITYTCKREGCGHTYTLPIHVEHNYVIEVTEPTCTVDGVTTYTCTECGHINKITIPASHSYISEITKPATRYEDGVITYTCPVCNDSYIEVIPASNANILVIQDRIPWDINNIPTLLNDMKAKGYITGWTMTTTARISEYELSEFDVILIANDQTTATYNQLRTLDEKITEFVIGGGTVIYGACDHGWSGGDISFNILGTVEKTDFYSQRNYIVDATHPIVTGALTDDKAITNALLHGTYCSHSGFVASTLPTGYNIILQDAQGNATLAEYPLGNGKVIVSGLTWEFYYSRIYTGTTSYSMNVFDDLIAYAVKPTSNCEHKYDAGVVVEATCTTEGYTVHTCSVCGASYKDTYVPALGHVMGEWIVDSVPNCVTPGSQHQVCTRCGETVVSVVPAFGHTVSDWIIDREPSEFEDGLKHKECTVCNTVLAETTFGHIHFYTEYYRVDATCTTYGEVGYICRCGNTYSATIAPTGHSYYLAVKVNPTCTEDGYEDYGCNNCDVMEHYVFPALGHTESDWIIDREPTDLVDGLRHKECTVCNTVLAEEIFGNGNVHVHSYTETRIEAGCLTYGEVVYTCACGDTYSEILAPTGHDHQLIVTVAPNCTVDGESIYACHCGDTYSVVIPALGHNYQLTETIAPTCVADGAEVYTCDCGDTYSVVIPMIAHYYYLMTTVAPTCEADGYEEYGCNNGCGTVERYTISRLYVAGSADPTCTEDGYIAYGCHGCGEIDRYVISKLGHNHQVVDSAEATCTTDGFITKICTVCYEEETEVFPALGHNYQLTIVAPTCTEDGAEVYTCHCGDTYSIVLPMLGHDYYLAEKVNETCTTDGFEDYGCYRCDILEHYVFPAFGHDYYLAEKVDETCTEDGYEDYRCNNCDIFEHYVFPAFGHTHELTSSTEATCTEDGADVYTCHCGDTYSIIFPAFGHTHELTTVEPTCTEDGADIYTCHCGDTYSVVIPMLGHDYYLAAKAESTCTEYGYEDYGCHRCDIIEHYVIAMAPHDYELTSTVAPTCTAEGAEVYTCHCGATHSVAIPKLVHEYNFITRVEPTCEADGYEEYGCDNCDTVERYVISRLYVAGSQEPTCTENGYIEYGCHGCDEVQRYVLPALGHNFVQGACANCGATSED